MPPKGPPAAFGGKKAPPFGKGKAAPKKKGKKAAPSKGSKKKAMAAITNFRNANPDGQTYTGP
jgi:hypothetical protein